MIRRYLKKSPYQCFNRVHKHIWVILFLSLWFQAQSYSLMTPKLRVGTNTIPIPLWPWSCEKIGEGSTLHWDPIARDKFKLKFKYGWFPSSMKVFEIIKCINESIYYLIIEKSRGNLFPYNYGNSYEASTFQETDVGTQTKMNSCSVRGWAQFCK